MTLRTICEDALLELSGFELPSSFFGNGNLTARSCVALVQRAGRTLERELRWAELIQTHTFTTVAGTASYDLPSDFRAFANMSWWDRTNSRRLVGPASGMEWQWLKGDIAAGATIDRWFRIQGTKIYIHPTPTASGDTIAFDYYSKNWITEQSTGNGATTFTSDNDTVLLDETLLALDLKWRFLQSKGMPFEPEYKEFEAVKEALQSDNGGRRKINLGPPTFELTNLPDTNFGST